MFSTIGSSEIQARINAAFQRRQGKGVPQRFEIETLGLYVVVAEGPLERLYKVYDGERCVAEFAYPEDLVAYVMRRQASEIKHTTRSTSGIAWGAANRH